MAKVNEVRDFMTTQIVVGGETGETTVTFKFNDSPADAKFSMDGVNWFDVSIVHKAISAFVDRHPLEFAEE